MADDSDKQGISEAHTRPDLEPSADQVAKIGDQAAVAQVAMDDLANQVQPEDDPAPPDLFEDEPSLFAGPVKHVAETLDSPKGRGRRKGSKNKANQLFRDTLLKMGFQHPGINLAALANADPIRLAGELGCKPIEAANLVKSANAELMPYFESKRPVEVEVTEQKLHVLQINMGDAGKAAENEGLMSITGTIAESDDKSDT
ncbi:MAG: hypothetical protein AAFX90_19510 [Pseudomonadota bacterium]